MFFQDIQMNNGTVFSGEKEENLSKKLSTSSPERDSRMMKL